MILLHETGCIFAELKLIQNESKSEDNAKITLNPLIYLQSLKCSFVRSEQSKSFTKFTSKLGCPKCAQTEVLALKFTIAI